MKGLNVKKVQEMFKRWRFRLSDIEYGVDVVYTGKVHWKGTYGGVKTCALL